MKKIFQTVNLLYQYVLYTMIKEDAFFWRGKMSFYSSKIGAVGILGMFETWIIAILAVITLALLGIDRGQIGIPTWGYFIYVTIIIWINNWLLGPPSRTEHYKRVFDAWTRAKRLRWRIYLFLLGVSALLSLLVAGSYVGLPK
jgi:hypothetical protein